MNFEVFDKSYYSFFLNYFFALGWIPIFSVHALIVIERWLQSNCLKLLGKENRKIVLLQCGAALRTELQIRYLLYNIELVFTSIVISRSRSMWYLIKSWNLLLPPDKYATELTLYISAMSQNTIQTTLTVFRGVINWFKIDSYKLSSVPKNFFYTRKNSNCIAALLKYSSCNIWTRKNISLLRLTSMHCGFH